MISIAEALARMMPRFSPLDAERVPLDRALGRFLAGALEAREDVPGFDNSAMDGYAVSAADLASASRERPVVLPMASESRAGGPLPSPLAHGTVARIFTGAPMPEGADAVVMQEDVERRGEAIAFFAAASAGKHVRRRAEVLARGGALLDAGAPIGAGEIGVLASQGFALVPVQRRPRVALLSTGDEQREIGEPPRAGSLVDSNAHALAAAVREAGGVPIVLTRAPDDRGLLLDAVKAGLAAADVLVTCGGVSVGEYDLLHETFRDAGVEEVFWKVRIKPGKPLRFGSFDRGARGAVPVIGLPGNPVSALLTFEVFVRPGLRRMLGDPRPFRDVVDVELAGPLAGPGARTELVRARLERRDGAMPLAFPKRDQGSGNLTSLVGLDALVIVPEASAGTAPGVPATALDLRGGRGRSAHPFGEPGS
jgi:molybdopterin molybdotransferase